jgi:peptidoglycan/LPS O-acetylase OafA/YrhL
MQPQETPHAAKPAHYRPDIDGLRAFAVLAVVIFHANPGALRGGFVGVDVFFVISGFLITGIILDDLDKARFSLLDFYARRIRRLFPALILVLASVWIAGWAFLLIDEFKTLGKHIAAGAAFIPNFIYWLEFGYFDVDSSRKILLHLWSLGVEEQYYLVWPLLLLLITRKTAAVLLIAPLIVLSFSVNLYLTFHSPTAAFYLPLPRFWELLIGSLLAYAAHSTPDRSATAQFNFFRAITTENASYRMNEAKAWIGFALIVIAVLEISKWRAFPGFWALLPTLGTALLIAAGPAATVNRIILGNRAMVAIGLISYPLYLWHWPLLAFAENIRGYDLTKLQRFLIVIPAFPLAWATYRFAERPIRFSKSQQGLEWKSLALLGAMTGLFALGLWTYARDGFPSRFPPELRVLLQHRHSPETSYRYGKCFLDQERQEGSAFASECVEAATSPRKPLLLIWGDSHGAHLYPGFRHLQNAHGFRLGQLTACAPFDHPRMSTFCKLSNAAVEKRVTEFRPEIVVLAMRWSQQADIETALRARADFLRANGAKEIIVVGPPPQWQPDLKGALAYNYFLNGKLETRMKFGLTRFEVLTQQDNSLARAAEKLGLRYLSALKALCNGDGCVTTADQMPFAIDSDHFSDAGSVYFAESVKAEIAAALGSLNR